MDKKSKNTLIVSIIALALVLIGVTYAYFSARITGLESASTISLTAGRMGIQYSEGDEAVIMNNIYPRSEAWVTKTITLTGWNTTDQHMRYRLGLNVTSNTFTRDYLTYDLTVLESTNGSPVSEKVGAPINGTGFVEFGRGYFDEADGDVHRYELKIYFKDNGKDQNDAQGAIFNAKINVSGDEAPSIITRFSYTRVRSVDIDETQCEAVLTDWGYNAEERAIFCAGGAIDEGNSSWQAGDGQQDDVLIQEGIITNIEYETVDVDEPFQGLEFVSGPYLYRYGQSYYSDYDWAGWLDRDEDGWGVVLKDAHDNYNESSSDPITEAPYAYINGEPVIFMSSMFSWSNASSIDLSNFDTYNVVDMSNMFFNVKASSLDLSSFNTSSLTSLRSTFYNCQATTIDLSTFDTSNVTNMRDMFKTSEATTIDVSSFDTSNVTDMSGMFQFSEATTIVGVNNFNTSSVTTMATLFNGSHVSMLDLSSWDTSNVEDMSWMFGNAAMTSLNISSFDTSNVDNMNSMFYQNSITNLDLSSFDTSNVTNMQRMFQYSLSGGNLDLTSFDTSNVTSMLQMFDNSSYTSIDLSSFDTSNVTNMSGMFSTCSNLTTIYASSSFVTTHLASDGFYSGSKDMFKDSTNLVGGNGTRYNSNYINKIRAKIDAPGSAGYFTAK